jgi:hypothetical protein
MKRLFLAALLLILSAILALVIVPPSQALPEYSAQTGEPCAACHISPSGGGLRTPRGQAWVGGGRPGAVPALGDALAALGVRLQTNEKDFIAPPGAKNAAPRTPLTGDAAAQANTHAMGVWLRTHEGN